MVVKEALYNDVKVRNRPSFYATPVAWAAADFTQLLIQDDGPIEAHRTGLVIASDECSLSTIRGLSCTAAQGTISPLRFAGASPSIVAGLPALQQGLRGPTLTLTMPPEHASSAILAIIEFWMRHGDIVSVVAIAHYRQDECRHLFKGFIAGSAGDVSRQGVGLRQGVGELCDPRGGGCPAVTPDTNPNMTGAALSTAAGSGTPGQPAV